MCENAEEPQETKIRHESGIAVRYCEECEEFEEHQLIVAAHNSDRARREFEGNPAGLAPDEDEPKRPSMQEIEIIEEWVRR